MGCSQALVPGVLDASLPIDMRRIPSFVISNLSSGVVSIVMFFAGSDVILIVQNARVFVYFLCCDRLLRD